MFTRPHLLSLGLGGVALAATLGTSNVAHAGLDACGNIHVEADAHCEVLVEGGCVAQCEPIKLEAACAAELYANCEGQCNAEASVDCHASCEADCSGQCEVDPGTFDCRVACEADCSGQCDASCSSDDSECHAACEATCTGECDGRCEATPPSASCDARCEAACDGSCEAKANVDCQVDCQAGGYAMCTADLQGGCEAQCQRPEGALFCDGQYIDDGGNLDACIAALEAELNIEVEGYADAECRPGACEAEAGGSVSCAVVGGQPGEGRWWIGFGVAGLLGLVGLRRRFA